MNTKMNTALKVLTAGAISLLVLTGCASTTEAGPTGVSHSSVPQPVLTDEDLFLQAVRSDPNAYLQSAADSDLLNAAYETCNMLNQGYTVTDLVTILAESGTAANQEQAYAMGFIIGSAIQVFCPQYLGQVSQGY